MKTAELLQRPHRRFNPLTRQWVLVSPQRMQRPWQGKVEKTPQAVAQAYDPQCYLCPGNARAGGARNPDYASTFVFENDFPALLPETAIDATDELNESGLLIARGEPGICRVLCFSPRHNLTVGSMADREIRKVLDVWVQQYQELGGIPWINHVQIFENQGPMMGASNPHPHCQLWAGGTLPNQTEAEQSAQLEYFDRNGRCLLCTYLDLELKEDRRIVCRNQDFVVLVPFWAVWPFEVMVLSLRHLGAMDELKATELDSLAEILRRLCVRYDNLFQVPFPYTMGFHQRPTDGSPHPEWHFHAHYYPPLLRSATVPKFMVGYEMLGSPQRDISPEIAAERLRETGEIHYLTKA